MTLILSVLRCPDSSVPETRRVTGGELCIGRDPLRAQWVLPDSTQQISRQHCTVRFDGTAWQVQDTSANGTFINLESKPLGQGTARILKNADRIRIGPYEIEARIEAPARAASSFMAQSPLPPEWGDSLFPEHSATADGSFGLNDSGTPSMFDEDATPASFGDPSNPLPPDLLAGGSFAALEPQPQSTVPDHTPSFTDAFAPPRKLLSDDWAKEFEFEDPFKTPAPLPPGRDKAGNPFSEPGDPDKLPLAPIVAPPPAGPDQTPDVTEDYMHNGGHAPPPLPTSKAGAFGRDAGSGPADSALLTAFMEGAGLPDLTPQNPITAMREAGAAFRAFVSGLLDVLMVRAEVKGAMGIDKTTIQRHRNNPLKFAANDDDALTALLGTGRKAGIAPADAVAEALRDIRMHEQATLPAMQAAIRALLGRLDPEKLRAAGEGGIALPAQRRARAFEHFETEYASLVEGLADDFDAVFGRRFAEEYDRIIADLRAGESKQ